MSIYVGVMPCSIHFYVGFVFGIMIKSDAYIEFSRDLVLDERYFDNCAKVS